MRQPALHWLPQLLPLNDRGSYAASPQGRTLSGMVSQYLSLVESAGKLSAYKDAEFVALLQVGAGLSLHI